jgi:alpha-tubulin suppressor-like RCC1 family protein
MGEFHGNPANRALRSFSRLAALLGVVSGAPIQANAQSQAIGWGSNVSGQLAPPSTRAAPVRSIRAGGFHLCTLQEDGSVTCLGANGFGQSTPPPGLGAVRQVAAGKNHTVAVGIDGIVRCWGINTQGLLSPPASVSTVADVSCGADFSLALRPDGSVVGWGSNSYGKCLGTDATGNWISGLATGQPVQLLGTPLGHVVRVSAGDEHAIALGAQGSIVAWGYFVAPGSAASPAYSPPTALGPALEVAAGGSHALALRADGSVICWGANQYGQCRGTSATGSPLTSAFELGSTVMIGGVILTNVAQVSAGLYYSAALKSDGSVVCWGNLGRLPPSFNGAKSISAGRDFLAVVRANGEASALSWGPGSTVPPWQGPCDDLVEISAGSDFVAARRTDGTIAAWGSNALGQLLVPQSATGALQIVAGRSGFALALRSDGTVVGWGTNASGQCLGTGASGQALSGPASGQPVRLLGSILSGVRLLAATTASCAAVQPDGTVVCWGSHLYSQLSPPAGLVGVSGVSGGAYHFMARTTSGNVVCWGAGASSTGTQPEYGQSQVPARATSVIGIGAGYWHSLAVRADGAVIGWGRNNEGQTDIPASAHGASALAGGLGHSAALLPGGSVVSWGLGTNGQTPTPPGVENAISIGCGANSTHALLSVQASQCGAIGTGSAATVAVSGSTWADVATWTWLPPQYRVPGTTDDVTIGDFMSLSANCDAACRTLAAASTSALLVPVDLTQPLAGQDRSIDVGGLATLRGRVWLLASGAGVLPADFSLPVVSAGSFDGLFTIIQTTVPPPAGKFLTLVPTAGLVGGGWSLALRDLPSSLGTGTGTTGAVAGTAVAAEAMDYNGDGFDDLALAIDNGDELAGTLQVLLNDGTGNLGTVSYLRATAARPTSLGVGDVNGDGKEDAVVGTASDLSARVFLNAYPQEAPPFSESTRLSAAASPLSVAVLPWPNPRVAVGTSAGAVSIYDPVVSDALQTTTVSMTPTTTRPRGRIIVTGGANPNSVDGLLPPAFRGRLVVLTPDTTGTYAVTQQVDVPGKPVNMDIADIDRDGIDDAMTANAEPQQLASGTPLAVLTLFRGTAAGFNGPTPIAPQGASAGGDVAMVDVNADGVRDIVSVHQTVVGSSAATAILVNQDSPGGPLTLGTQDAIAATRPILCPRGDVRGPNGEGVYIVDAGSSAFDGGSSLVPAAPAAIPYRAQCGKDLDGDSIVNGADLAMLLVAWGTAEKMADLDRNGIVDGADLAAMLGAWGPCEG